MAGTPPQRQTGFTFGLSVTSFGGFGTGTSNMIKQPFRPGENREIMTCE